MPTQLESRVLLPVALLALLGSTGGCLSESPTFLAPADEGPGPMVKFDVYHKPFPEIPLPNDFATRFDPSSPTLRRLNASILAGPTRWEQETRAELDRLSGWGTLAPITVSFDAPIEPEVIFDRHWRDNYDFSDDAVLVLNLTPDSPDFCEAVPLDMGQGNYPQVLPEQQLFDADNRMQLQTAVFEEVEEDVNGNGVLDPGEDTDMDGVLDHPNTRDGTPGSELLEFYERETNTLIMKPVVPMREETTYAVVLTKRLVSPDGDPVRSPFAGIHHAGQKEALTPLAGCLDGYGLALDDVAFTWSFTTQSISHDYLRIRDGLYGLGPLAHLAEEFPAELSSLDDVRDAAPGVTNTKIVPMTEFMELARDLLDYTGASGYEIDVLSATLEAVDFIVGGAIRSPQFFPREDDSGAFLPLYRQVWNLDEPPRGEDVPFWMFVPKNRNGPAPVAVFIHGHGSTKFDALLFAGIFANYGIATMGIDAPSHGVDLSQIELNIILAFFQQDRMLGLGESLINGRALDWTGDGELNSGDDYWVAYVVHSRDMVRQTMVDMMQLVRVLRSFDGVNRWEFDPTGSGTPGLAGDFDGDGEVDVGGDASLHAIGGSLGGITSAVLAGVEPQLETVVSIIPGGMLSEVGTRSTLGGVKNAMMLRALGPIFYADGDAVMVRTNLGNTGSVALRVADDLPELTPEDTVVLTNGQTAEWRCGAVQPSGTFRVAVSCDAGDPLELRIYHGPLPAREREGCEPDGEEPYYELTTFGQRVQYAGETFQEGSALVAPTDGFGLRRGTPDLRRFLGLSQIILDSADPMNWAPYWDGTRTMTYGTGETVQTNVLVIPSVGDTGVAVASGIGLARAAGLIPYDTDDPRYGMPANQKLIDSYAVEGTYRLGRHVNSVDEPVLMDVEHLASVVPVDDGFDVPRLDPPLRLVSQDPDDGIYRGFILPMLRPQGQHGFPRPDPTQAFDLGTYLLNIVSRYIASGGQEFSWDACQAISDCPWDTFPLP